MKPKKPTNFKQQIQNSQKFLQKLQTLKKTSKDIKQKNKLTQHRNLWVKEFKYLSRLERDMDMELGNYFQVFDRHFQVEIEERQVFGGKEGGEEKGYSGLRQRIEENFERFQAETYRQVQSLPLLASKLTNPKQPHSKPQQPAINKTDIIQILTDISHILRTIAQQNTSLQQQLTHQQHHNDIETKINSQNFQQYEQQDLTSFSALKQIASEIRGFDMEKQKITKLKQAEENLVEYLECFNDKLGEDQIYEVINEFNVANRLLEETYALEGEKIALDYEDALRLDDGLLEGSENFSKISHIYSTYIGRGKSVQLYFERLSIEFPKMNRKNLQMITSYIEAKIYKQKKLKAMKRNYYRQKQELFAKVDKEIHTRIEKKIEKARKKAEELERKEERLKLEKELEVLRADYNKRKDEAEKVKKEEEMALKEAERKKEAIRRLYLDELSKKADQVHQVKTQKQMDEQRALQTKKMKQEQQKRKKIEANKPKVHLRQSIERRKIIQKVEQRQIRSKQPQLQAQRIKNAIQSYNFRPKVQFSQQRLNKPTQALIKRKQTIMDMADKVELSKMTGYSVNQLMSDMRFKVNMALQEAGLSNTDYARELLVGMSKRPGGGS